MNLNGCWHNKYKQAEGGGKSAQKGKEMSKWEYFVAKNDTEELAGNFEESFESLAEAKKFAEKLGADAVIVECEILSER